MRLNLGCGGVLRKGWVNVDRAAPAPLYDSAPLWESDAPAFLEHDLTEPLPWRDDSAEYVVTHHVLDLLEPDALFDLLGEIERILIPGGTLRVSSVDYDLGLRAACAGDLDWFEERLVPTDDGLAAAFSWWYTCGGARKTPLTTPVQLGRWLLAAGLTPHEVAFNETIAGGSICDLDSREHESWFVEGRKKP